jgi:hypothetical protein
MSTLVDLEVDGQTVRAYLRDCQQILFPCEFCEFGWVSLHITGWNISTICRYKGSRDRIGLVA